MTPRRLLAFWSALTASLVMMRDLENEQIEQMRRDYANPALPVAHIATTYQISVAELAALRRTHGWPSRRSGSRRPKRRDRSGQESVAGPQSVGRKSAGTSDQKLKHKLVRRLYQAIERKLFQLETSMNAAEHPSAADSERETRAIGTLINNLEKVAELETDLTRARAGDPKSTAGLYDAESADRRRRALAERLERLRERRTRSAGGADGGAG